MLTNIIGYLFIVLLEIVLGLILYLTIRHDRQRIQKWLQEKEKEPEMWLNSEIEKINCLNKN